MFVEAIALEGAGDGLDKFLDNITKARAARDGRYYTERTVGIRAAVTADGAVEDVGAFAKKLPGVDVRAEHDERAEGFGGVRAVFHEIETVIV